MTTKKKKNKIFQAFLPNKDFRWDFHPKVARKFVKWESSQPISAEAEELYLSINDDIDILCEKVIGTLNMFMEDEGGVWAFEYDEMLDEIASNNSLHSFFEDPFWYNILPTKKTKFDCMKIIAELFDNSLLPYNMKLKLNKKLQNARMDLINRIQDYSLLGTEEFLEYQIK